MAITSVLLTILYGQTRITFAMCRDGLLPEGLARLTRRRTPWLITLIFGLLAAGFAAVIPLAELAELVNIGNAVRVRARQHRRDLAAPQPARSRAPVPRPAACRRRYPKSRRPVRLAARSARVSW